jgi:hypothetical protein
MTNKLVWRLSKLPTPSELTELVKEKIITQEEAKEILFSENDVIISDFLCSVHGSVIPTVKPECPKCKSHGLENAEK